MDENFDVREQVEHDRLVLGLLFEFRNGEFDLFGVIVECDDAFFSNRLDSLDDWNHIFLFFRHKSGILWVFIVDFCNFITKMGIK